MCTAGTGALPDCWTVCMCVCVTWLLSYFISWLGLVSSRLVSNQWQVKGVAGMKPYTAAVSLTSKCSVTPNPVAQCSVALRCVAHCPIVVCIGFSLMGTILKFF